MSNVDTLSPSLFSDPAMSPRSPRLPRFTFENQAMVARLGDYTASGGPVHAFRGTQAVAPVSEDPRQSGIQSFQLP